VKKLKQELMEITGQVDKKVEELVELCKTLISYKTPAPPARNTADVQKFIGEYLQNLGFSIDQWDVYPGDPNVVGTLKGLESNGYQSLIINGHIDVAAVEEGENWETDPFIPFLRDGRLYGRGASDMKGGMACALFAMKLLHDSGIHLPGDLIFQ
jgi:acetylornithine deacetylase/succinyl-diaminopimelate desuccinylase-like protein